MTIIHQYNEIGQVLPGRRAIEVGHLQSQTLILDISFYTMMGLGGSAKLGLPVTATDSPVDMATARIYLAKGLHDSAVWQYEPEVWRNSDAF